MIFTEFYDVEMYKGQLALNQYCEYLKGFSLIGKFGNNALFLR